MMFKNYTMCLKLLLPVALVAGCAEPVSSNKPLVVFLVRHAEKVDTSDESELSPAGKQRAVALVQILRDADVEYVHSTNFTRTRTTAAPVADECGLKVDLYDAGDLPALAKQLQNVRGRHLVVGHSNTTPELAELLGGEPAKEIQENEYDRLYLVVISGDGIASTVLLRYGDSFVEGQGE